MSASLAHQHIASGIASRNHHSRTRQTYSTPTKPPTPAITTKTKANAKKLSTVPSYVPSPFGTPETSRSTNRPTTKPATTATITTATLTAILRPRVHCTVAGSHRRAVFKAQNVSFRYFPVAHPGVGDK